MTAMIHAPRIALALAAAFLLHAGTAPDPGSAPNPAPASAPASVSGFAAVKAALTQAVAQGITPGAVYWCDHGGAATHWAQGNRSLMPRREPMTEDTLFDAASLTKVVATLPSIMLLMERGRLNLDDPVQRHIPEFPHRAVTVRHLLTHTSGLPASLRKNPADPAWRGYDEGIRRACACLPDPPPGHAFRYSDVNFILLGEIVRRVSGRPLDAFAEQEVFRPLGMASSGFRPGRARARHAAPTERDEHGVMLRGTVHDPTARRMGGVAGHAGLFTTAGDLAKYARFILRGGPLLKPETRRLMCTVQTPPPVADRRGLGWDIDSLYSRPRGSLFSLESFGHTGFTGTTLWLDPRSDTFYILLTTRLHPDGKGDTRALNAEVGTLTARAIGLTARPEGAVFERKAGEVPTVLNGIDVLERQHFARLQGLRIGLVTNQTGLDSERRASLDLLHDAPGVKLAKVFTPEHGLRGDQDTEGIPDAVDPKTGLPVLSLYRSGLRRPTRAQLADLDALVFDIQDVGSRFYTYIATLKGCLEAAAEAGIQVIVLDRVNPIRGDLVEGPVTPGALSFTACHPIAIRHGMTPGELARMFNAELHLGVNLQVVELQGWHRSQWFDHTGLPWTDPSPNMRNLTAAALYPGVGLLERALSVGRGTGTPFEVVGAPYIQDRALAFELNKLGLPGVRFIPERFTPAASTFAGRPCGGVRILITDRNRLRPVELGLALAVTLHRLYGAEFDLAKANALLADDATLELIRSGKPCQDIVASWEPARLAFLKRREPFLLYAP